MIKGKTSSQKLFSIIIVLLLIITVISVAIYFVYGGEDYIHYTYGEVIDCALNSLVVREYNQSGNTQIFLVFTMDSDTILSDSNGNQIEFQDIKPGMQICVSYPYKRRINSPGAPRTDIFPSSVQLIDQ